ncbi:DNA repair protein Rad26 [Aspergillus luchuensis]|uniref:DNA repair protein Rad26 n=1 Tax=Aspergillus kawachii TaxID=1069201 RepID=A0A146FZL6_ASPKA|nr:DNA repair protein Rad26 [Aspergillus luchuensis]
MERQDKVKNVGRTKVTPIPPGHNSRLQTENVTFSIQLAPTTTTNIAKYQIQL